MMIIFILFLTDYYKMGKFIVIMIIEIFMEMIIFGYVEIKWNM
jgi:hypothetical protein